MSTDYYAGEPSIDEQINNQNMGQKTPLKLIMIILLVLTVILMIVFLFTNLNKEVNYDELDKNNFLKSLVVSGGSLDKNFDKKVVRYRIKTSAPLVKLTCAVESSKAKLENCKSITISEDLTRHQIKVTAENGNVKIYYLTIIKIVDQPVRIDEVLGVPQTWTTNSVTITVKASADDGLHSQAYSYDNGQTWVSSPNLIVNINQTIKIMVRDINELKSPVNDVYIGKIDQNQPSVNITAIETARKATLFAIVTPPKTASGYIFKWYRNNVQIPGTTAALDVFQSGSYHVVVTTGAGKTAKSQSHEVRLR